MRHVTDRPQGIAQQLLQLAAEACQPVLCRGGLRQMRRQPGAGRGAQGDFGGVVVQVLVFVPRIVRAAKRRAVSTTWPLASVRVSIQPGIAEVPGTAPVTKSMASERTAASRSGDSTASTRSQSPGCT